MRFFLRFCPVSDVSIQILGYRSKNKIRMVFFLTSCKFFGGVASAAGNTWQSGSGGTSLEEGRGDTIHSEITGGKGVDRVRGGAREASGEDREKGVQRANIIRVPLKRYTRETSNLRKYSTSLVKKESGEAKVKTSEQLL